MEGEAKQPLAQLPAAQVVLDASRPIEKAMFAAAARPQMIVPPRSCKQLVRLTCDFGGAVVRVSFSERNQPYLRLPAANTWEWILGPEECLIATTTVDTIVTGVSRDVAWSGEDPTRP